MQSFVFVLRSTVNPVDTANGPIGVADRAKMDSEVCACIVYIECYFPYPLNSVS